MTTDLTIIPEEHIDRSDGGTDWQIEQDSDEYTLYIRDADCWFQARVKYDGCIEFIRFFNQPFDLAPAGNEDYDQMHICDLDDTIERLTKLRDVARNYFGTDWNNNG